MQKVTITKIYTKEEISPRTNKPYTRMSIKAQEYGDKWISGFQNKGNANWKEGDTVEVIIEETKKDDKTYLNYSLPKVEDVQHEELTKLSNRVTKIEIRQTAIEAHLGIKSPEDYTNLGEKPTVTPEYPEEEINLEDIPF